MMKMTTAKLRRIAFVLIFALTITSFAGIGANSAVTVQAATNGIVKGPNEVDAEDSFTTTLSSGESTTIKIVNSVLTIKVDATDYTFQIGNIKSTTDAAVVNEKDGLLHILTLGGVYYVFDLYTGVQIVAYRNSSNGKYCSSRNAYAYMVYGKSLINNTYFYELLSSNSVVRELLMTRAEFDAIVNGGDPSVDPIPTQAPKPTDNPVPTQEPIPTVAPTDDPVPTQAPIPTVAPTENPVPTVAPIPTQTPDITIKFDFEFWWEKYISGVITWEQFTQVMYQYQWRVDKTATEKETTYYFYDDKGNLIRTERILVSTGQETGSGNGSATITNKGDANVSVTEKGDGGVTGTVTVTTNKSATTKATTKKTTKKKAHARVVTSGSRIKLFTAKNKLHGWLIFNRKTGKLNWNGYKMKGVKSAGFIQGSWNVIVLMKNGKVYKLPKKVAKGKTVHKTRIKCEKGIALNRDTYGFVYKVKTRCGGLKNVSGK